jgi:hypothetical protein
MAIEDIRRLKARYFRFLDTKQWDEFARLFAPEAVLDGTESFLARHPLTGKPFVNGRADLVEGLDIGDMLMVGGETIAAKGALLWKNVVTVHHGHMADIEIVSDNEATAIWAMEDRLLFLDPTSPIKEIQGFGHYHESYRMIEGQWKIASSRISRLRVDVS